MYREEKRIALSLTLIQVNSSCLVQDLFVSYILILSRNQVIVSCLLDLSRPPFLELTEIIMNL